MFILIHRVLAFHHAFSVAASVLSSLTANWGNWSEISVYSVSTSPTKTTQTITICYKSCDTKNGRCSPVIVPCWCIGLLRTDFSHVRKIHLNKRSRRFGVLSWYQLSPLSLVACVATVSSTVPKRKL